MSEHQAEYKELTPLLKPRYILAAKRLAALKVRANFEEWRRLDTAEDGDPGRVAAWMRGGRQRECALTVTSAAAHRALTTHVAGARTRGRVRLPDADAERLR